ncbi:MAG: HD domain-containing protein [Oscillospiraceae bacterium]|nr:HD domain-containing protein [Oscillospiraceae bacterium]
MNARELLNALAVAERLKDTTRHCYTTKGRHESVAEHSWMVTLMAFFIKNEFPEADMNKIIQMCIIHDLGECFTGDIPVFDKSNTHRDEEETLLNSWVKTLPEPTRSEMLDLYKEMEERQTLEAKIYKALDGLEALIQHNLSDLSTWSENEYSFNLTYAEDRVTFSEYLTLLREEIKKDTIQKIDNN